MQYFDKPYLFKPKLGLVFQVRTTDAMEGVITFEDLGSSNLLDADRLK